MKARIAHIILFGLLLLGICSCGEGSDEPLAAPVPVLLDLDIALATRADGEQIPAWEEVKQLRIILMDEEGNVECNQLFTGLTPEVSGPPYRYVFNVQLKTTTGQKRLYAVANAEDIDFEGSTREKVKLNAVTTAAQLEGLVMTGEIRDAANGGDQLIPLASKCYEIDLNTGDAVVKQEVVMAYAAVKFDFTYVNMLSEAIEIDSWAVSEVSQGSYLIPHIGEKAWEQLIALGGTESSRPDDPDAPWVTDYEIPPGYVHGTYEHTYTPSIQLGNEATAPDKNIYYMHESKSLLTVSQSKATPEEQQYSLTLTVRKTGETTPIRLSAMFPNLKSLVRGTHVKVQATIKKLPSTEIIVVEAKIVGWIVEGPVEGDWEEV